VRVYTVSIKRDKKENFGLISPGISIQDAFPNPFNASTIIRYELQEQSIVHLEIYDLLGQKVRTLFRGEQPAGIHNIQWNGLNFAGISLPSGVYLYRVNAGDFSQTRKMLLLR